MKCHFETGKDIIWGSVYIQDRLMFGGQGVYIKLSIEEQINQRSYSNNSMRVCVLPKCQLQSYLIFHDKEY